MGIDATGYILALLTIGMSMVATRYKNMLLTLGSAALWATLLAFILANTTAGTNWQSMFILSTAAFLCAFALISFLGRNRQSSFTENIGGLMSREKEDKPSSMPRRGLSDLSEVEYKQYVRRVVRRRRR